MSPSIFALEREVQLPATHIQSIHFDKFFYSIKILLKSVRLVLYHIKDDFVLARKLSFISELLVS